MTAFEVKYRPIIVYADTFADLAAIPADLTLTKHAFILDSGDEYVLEPKSTVWQKLTDAEAEAIAELEAELEANRIYNTASSAAVCSFSDGADNIPMKSLIAEIAPVQAGSGDPSPDNVRPISGWDGVTVTRNGANQWDEEWEVGTFSFSTGEPATASDMIRSVNFIAVKPSTTYYANFSELARVLFYDNDKSFLGVWGNNSWWDARSFDTPSDCHYIKFVMASAYGTTYNHDISINYPATDTTYHPYTGQTYPITFPTPPGTVYGGTLDLISGVLTVDRAIVDLGDLPWVYRESGTTVAPYFYADVSSLGIKYEGAFGSTVYHFICSMYYAASRSTATFINGCACFDGIPANEQVAQIQIKDARLTDAASFKTTVTGQKLVYMLAEPVTYQLTPTEVTSLLKNNVIFANTGDAAATYVADPKTYIDNAIATAVAALS